MFIPIRIFCPSRITGSKSYRIPDLGSGSATLLSSFSFFSPLSLQLYPLNIQYIPIQYQPPHFFPLIWTVEPSNNHAPTVSSTLHSHKSITQLGRLTTIKAIGPSKQPTEKFQTERDLLNLPTIRIVHPQNVQLHNVQLQNVQLHNVQLQNVQLQNV